MFRFVDALEIETDIQLKIECKDYNSALQLYTAAKEKADIVLSNPAILQWVLELVCLPSILQEHKLLLL